MSIRRGDIYYVEWRNGSYGSEQTAGRPAVVVSNDIGNHHSDIAMVVYLTTKEKKPLPTHAKVLCKVPSTAMCEQVSAVSQDRLIEYVRSCTDEEMKEIDRALSVALGLEEKLTVVRDCNEVELIDELKATIKEKNDLLEQCAERIDGLIKRNKYAEEELEIAKAKAKNDYLYSENETMKNDCGELEKVKETKSSEELVKLKTERDLYKILYEETLERLIG